jgi:hypothetical protein
MAECKTNPAGFLDHLSVHVDFDERGGIHLVVKQAERIEQEVIIRAGHANGNVVRRHVRHPVQINELIGRGQVAADPPLGGIHASRCWSCRSGGDER